MFMQRTYGNLMGSPKLWLSQSVHCTRMARSEWHGCFSGLRHGGLHVGASDGVPLALRHVACPSNNKDGAVMAVDHGWPSKMI